MENDETAQRAHPGIRGIRGIRGSIVCLSTMAALASCAADGMTGLALGAPNHSLVVPLGREFAITLGNVGPATYAAPPQISSTAIVYIDVSDVPPITPAGPNQRFRFRAVSRDVAIIAFRRTLGDSVVSMVRDTIRVR